MRNVQSPNLTADPSPLYFAKNTFKLISYALPISASMVISMLASFIAMLFVAELGETQLAAGALGVSTFMTLMTLVVTIFYAIGILTSHFKGHGKSSEEIGTLVKNGFWLAILIFIPSFLSLTHVDKLLLLFGQNPILVDLTRDYFYYAGLSMFPTLIGAVITQFYSGIGNPKMTFWVSVITLPALVFLSYFLILGKSGFPEMGLAGITCANFIVHSVFCVGFLLYACFGKKTKPYQILSGNLWPNFALCKTILMLGLPIGVQFGGELSAMAVCTYFVGFFGVQALAATQIAGQCSILVVMISLGLSQALSIVVSGAYSQHDYALIRRYMLSGLLLLCLIFVMVFSIFFLLPDSLINLYVDTQDSNNKDLVLLATQFLAVSAFLLFFDGIRNLFSSGLRGMQDSKAPMIIGLICLWLISLPVCYFTGFNLGGGPVGLRLGFSVGFILAALILWKRAWRKTKPLPSVKEALATI